MQMVEEHEGHDQAITDAEIIQRLGPDSYTGRLLHHANHSHLNITTRRRFIGPVPTGWLKSNQKSWLRSSTRTFVARRRASTYTDVRIARKRRLTGFEGPSAAATYHPSFPQPNDVDEGGGDNTVGEESDDTEIGSRAALQSFGLSSSDHHHEEDETSTVKPDQGHRPSAPDVVSRTSLSKIKNTTKSKQSSSYETAAETLATLDMHKNSGWQGNSTPSETSPYLNGQGFDSPRVISMASSGYDTGEGISTGTNTSTASLIKKGQGKESRQTSTDTGRVEARKSSSTQTGQKQANYNLDGNAPEMARHKGSQRGAVRFSVRGSTDTRQVNQSASAPGRDVTRTGSIKKERKKKGGQIIKMERMLVRIDATKQPLSKNYDDNESRKIDTKLVQKWREFMIVCRESDRENANLILQIYKTRVIPATNELRAKRKPKYEIALDRRESNINLYSSLDKALVLWAPAAKKTFIYILKSRSNSSAVEWYTFLRKVMGWRRPSELSIGVPDLGISLRINNPFEGLENLLRCEDECGNDDILLQTMRKEQAVATDIMNQCIEMLIRLPAWQDLMRSWLKKEKLGLTWQRYDRLEWIHGLNERKMYGTMAMLRTHELQLRPKKHYATEVLLQDDNVLVEPPPVEGFLVRLTTQKGSSRSIGRMYFKRLYFSTHDQFLIFTRPAYAHVPSYPEIPSQENSDVPSPEQISSLIPKIWEINPFPLSNRKISWLEDGFNSSEVSWRERDQRALNEAQRKTQMIVECDGYINLCNVRNIRHVVRGAVPTDTNVEEGSDVDFNMEVTNTREEDGSTKDFADERTFELKMKNGLVVRLQAHDNETKVEWMKCLRQLVVYWKRRAKADVALNKLIKQTNLEILGMDEETEAYLGQFAKKWELTKSYASADLYNMCGIASCRTIHMSGSLFLKPRRHATFNRCSVILCYGKLLIFRDAVRTRSGKAIPHVHHDRANSLDLKECYLYSGVLVENDLLYQNHTFDQNRPGHHALPRIFVDEDWTSVDEEYMTCFVLWHGKRRSFFRSPGGDDDDDGSGRNGSVGSDSRRSRLKLVSQLGVAGRSIVFKCRSRAERDHWVMAISLEIERLQQSEDVRIMDADE